MILQKDRGFEHILDHFALHHCDFAYDFATNAKFHTVSSLKSLELRFRTDLGSGCEISL